MLFIFFGVIYLLSSCVQMTRSLSFKMPSMHVGGRKHASEGPKTQPKECCSPLSLYFYTVHFSIECSKNTNFLLVSITITFEFYIPDEQYTVSANVLFRALNHKLHAQNRYCLHGKFGILSRGRILGRNPEKNLKSFPPC